MASPLSYIFWKYKAQWPGFISLFHFSDICFLRLDFEQFDVIGMTAGQGTGPTCAGVDHLEITVSDFGCLNLNSLFFIQTSI